jgi:3-oxoacyl-(acyl-carrier-protein) synthase/acyl carrier protein
MVASNFYNSLKNRGFEYSGIFQSLDKIDFNHEFVLASVNKHIKDLAGDRSYLFNIAIIDAAFQSLFVLIEQLDIHSQAKYVPAFCNSLSFSVQSMEKASYIYGQFKQQDTETGNLVFDINICDSEGNCLALIQDFIVAAIRDRASSVNSNQEYKTGYLIPAWKAVSPTMTHANHNSIYIDFGKKHPVGFKGLRVIPDTQFIQLDSQSIKADLSQVNSWKRIFNQAHQLNNTDPLHIIIATADDNSDQLLTDLFKLVKSLSVCLIDEPSINLIHLSLLVNNYPFNPVKALPGMLKSLQQENSRILCSSIEYPADISDEELLHLIDMDYTREKTNPVSAVARYREGQFSVQEFISLDVALNDVPQSFKVNGNYLITGGANGIGKIVAEYLSKQYRANLILIGRSGYNQSITDFLDDLKSNGSEAVYFSADVTNQDEMLSAIEKSQARFGKINGVIHSAGCTRDSYLFNKTQADFNSVISPKIVGTRILDQVTARLDLDFFVVFSSLASIIGNAGQTDYALANNYLDVFSQDRNDQVLKQQRSGKTIAINWPYWQQGGMQLSADNVQKIIDETGLAPMPSDSGLAALELCVAQSGVSQLAVTYGDNNKLPNLFRGKKPESNTAITQYGSTTAPLTEINPDDAKKWIVDQIKTFVSTETRWDANKISMVEPFGTYGIDSVMTLNLTKKLSGIFGNLPKTLFFEYQNVQSLSDYFVKNHLAIIGQQISQNPKQPDIRSYKANHDFSSKNKSNAKYMDRRQWLMSKKSGINANQKEPIAIIGLAGRYPDADNIQDFYRNLLVGRDSIQDIPDWRWDNKDYFDKSRHATGKTYSNWGGFIRDVDQFDPLFFNISPTDAITMDPQERLFLESSWNCIEDAGYSKAQLANSKTGVFAGIMWSHYHFSGIDTEPVQSKKYPESNYASVANRVSYWFGFTGPSMTIDTMCSSSLTAIHLACEAIRNNQCGMAIAGGVNLTLHPYKYLQLSGSQFLSTDGRCRSFGEGGDGYVPGEGVGSVLLKPLSKALADKDHIYGVINASSINHGGKSNGYNVPNPQAQAALIREAIDNSTINPADISYIEAHGTGTPLGDPIELQGIKKAFDGIEAPASCVIGSVKSNIGHLEAASGIAGLTKVLLQMKSKKIFPSLHAEKLNKNLDFSRSPFSINTRLNSWSVNNDRFVAGISSFGAGGSNAFLLVEAAPTDSKRSSDPFAYYPAVIVPVSARNDESLHQYLHQLVLFLENVKTGNSLFAVNEQFGSIIKTLQTGKTEFQSRIAIVVKSLDDLVVKLKSVISGNSNLEGIYSGFVENEINTEPGLYDDLADTAIDTTALNSIADYWVEGGNVNFEKIFKNISRHKVPLPTYCFDKKSYWYKGNSISATKSVFAGQSNDSHLLANQFLLDAVDFERSTQNGLTFKSTFTMENEVVFNHQFEGRELLPGAAYIVMLREAMDSFDLKSKNQLSNVRWQAPIFVESSVEVFTTIERHQDDCRYKIWTDGEHPHIHGIGELHHSNLPTSINWAALNTSKFTDSVNQDAFYKLFEPYGLAYTGQYRSIQKVRFNATEAIVDYSIASAARETTSLAEVAIIDACLQIFVLFHEKVSSEVKLPFSIDKLLFVKKPSLTGKLYVTQVHDDTGNVVVVDEKGEACIVLEGINFHTLNKVSTKPVTHKNKLLPLVDNFTEVKANVLEEVRRIFCASLRLEDADLKNKVIFDQYGMESVKAMEITHELEKLYGRLPSTLLYEYQTISSLVDFISTEKQDFLKKQIDIEKSEDDLLVTNLHAEPWILKDNVIEFSGDDLKQKIDQLADHEVDSLLNALLN